MRDRPSSSNQRSFQPDFLVTVWFNPRGRFLMYAVFTCTRACIVVCFLWILREFLDERLEPTFGTTWQPSSAPFPWHFL